MTPLEIVVTGRKFTGSGLRAIEPVMEELVRSARQEIHVMSYLFSDSARYVLSLLEDALGRGVQLVLVVNRIDGQPLAVREWLISIAHKFRHARVVDFSDPDRGQLHAKVIVADRQRAIVGSANFTWGGFVANHEIGFLVEGEHAWILASLADRLSSPDPSRKGGERQGSSM